MAKKSKAVRRVATRGDSRTKAKAGRGKVVQMDLFRAGKKGVSLEEESSSSPPGLYPSPRKTNSAPGRRSKPSSAPATRAKTTSRKPGVRTRETAESMGRKQREISVAEFFQKNRHLLGFDNPAKALLTATKEAVETRISRQSRRRLFE